VLEPPPLHARIGEAMFARRVMTAVLLLVATTVSPGVCDACPQSGCIRGAAASNSATACPACAGMGTAAVADSGCHGTPLAGQPRDGMEAGDGPLNSCETCRCMLAPRGAEDAVVRVAGDGVVLPDAASQSCVTAPVAMADFGRPLATAFLAGDLIPARPVRVLYGVWRN